jgi:hypothetical protein
MPVVEFVEFVVDRRRGAVVVSIGKITEYRASQPPELQFQSRLTKIRIVCK